MRCALTAPFHPYRSATKATNLGGSLSAALSVGFRPPGVTWHSALWSPDFPLHLLIKINKCSDCLASSEATLVWLGIFYKEYINLRGSYNT
jgi:hypothetical protein